MTEDAGHWLRYGEAKMLEAELSPEADKELLFLEARDALIRADKLEPGRGAWKLACISARLNNAKLCRKWLERAQKYDALPPSDELRNSPYLKSVQNQKWFKALF